MISAAHMAPIVRHSAIGRPCVRPANTPAANRSPAPVVSTSCATGSAPTPVRTPFSTAMAPCSPRVHTSNGTLAAIAATEASKSSLLFSAQISTSLENNMSMRPASISAKKSGPWREITKASDSVKATLRPAARATSIAVRIAARGSSGSHK